MSNFNRSDPGQGSGAPRYPGTFLLAFREAAEGLGWKVKRWLGPAVECTDSQGREQVVGLENLFRRIRREDRSRWPELIAEFFRCVPTDQLENPPANLAAVTERLLVRIGLPPGKNAELPLWYHPLQESGLGLNLVIDYPQSMTYVTEQMVAESGQAGEVWVERALANLAALTPEGDCLQVVDEETGLRHSAVGDAYDSSRALLLDRFLPESAEDGCFVAVPGRDELLILPVTADSLSYIPLLKNIAEKSYQSAPYTISDQVYWVRGGCWRHFPISIQGEKVVVDPPKEFLEILERLAPLEESGEGGETEEKPGE